MDRQEFFIDDYQMGGYLLNHNMTCDIAQNSTTLCLHMNASGGGMVEAGDKILLYFPDGSREGDLTNDGGKSIVAHLYGDDWQLTYVDHHPIYKTRVWTLRPERTYRMAQGESVSVEFMQVQVNTVPGMSRLCLVPNGAGNDLQVDIQKFAKPEKVSMAINPQEFVYGDEIKVCFTVTNPGQYKYISYCGRQLDKTKSSFEEKEVAACDAEYMVEITNGADYKVQSIYKVCLHGFRSGSITKVSQASVKLDMQLTEANVDRCWLHDESSGQNWDLAVKSGSQEAAVEVKEDRVFYPVVSLKGSTRQEQGEKAAFHLPVIKSFAPAPQYAVEDVEGFLSVEQVEASGISYASNCKVPPGTYNTFCYELLNVAECWLQTYEGRYSVDVKQKRVTIRSFANSGTVHAKGDYGYEVTMNVSW